MAKVYACPVHPEVRNSKPGKCPKCGVTLILLETGNSGPAPASAKDNVKRAASKKK